MSVALDVNTSEMNNGKSSVANSPQTGDLSNSGSGTALKVSRSFGTLLSHLFIGIVVGASIMYAFREGSQFNATNQHILLCVLGYNLLMGEAMLALAPDSWLTALSLKHRRWVHTGMQLVGSILALTGSFIMIQSKPVNWTSLHGKFALVALVFTTVSLVNGLASLYAYQLRRLVPGILSRLTHICFGIVSFGAACIALCYGMDKNSFRNWATSNLADALIAFVALKVTFIIINPFLTFTNKFRGAISS